MDEIPFDNMFGDIKVELGIVFVSSREELRKINDLLAMHVGAHIGKMGGLMITCTLLLSGDAIARMLFGGMSLDPGNLNCSPRLGLGNTVEMLPKVPDSDKAPMPFGLEVKSNKVEEENSP